MPFYRFELRNRSTKVEYLGSMALRDDSEALAFGGQTVEDLRTDANGYDGGVLNIIKGAQVVAQIPLKPE